MKRTAIVRASAQRISGFDVLGIFLVLLGIVAIWLLINSRDEALNSEARKALEAKHDSVPVDSNLFYAVLAIDSDSDGDLGQQGFAAYQAYLKSRNTGAEIDLNEAGTFERREFIGNKDELCGRPRQIEDCIHRAALKPAAQSKLVSDNQPLLKHYKRLASYTQFQDPIELRVDNHVLRWTAFLLGKRLLLSEAALLLNQGKVDTAIESIRGDLEFSRRILAQSDELLIDKAILQVSVRASLSFISEMLRTETLSDAQYAQVAEMAGPLTDRERSLAVAFTREFVAFNSWVDKIESSPPSDSIEAMERSYLKRNASLNHAWYFTELMGKMSEANCSEYVARAEQLSAQRELKTSDFFYNPLGRMIIKGGVLSPVSIQSVCDLEGMTRIVRLQARIHQLDMPDAEIAGFLQRPEAAAYRNPFDGKPMHFNVASRTLSFGPLSERDNGYFPWPL